MPTPLLASWFSEIFDLKTVVMLVVLIALIIFWMQYRKRQM